MSRDPVADSAFTRVHVESDDLTECTLCGAVDEPEADIRVSVDRTERRLRTVCNVCVPTEQDG
jgi:hypothetical protein